MLIASSSFLSDAGIVLAIVGLIAGAIFVIVARKGTADDNEAVKTATLMTGQIAALTSAQELSQAEIKHLRELIAEKDKTLDRNTLDIQRLTELVTQQAAVEQFRAEAFVWFEAIGKAVEAEPPKFADHVPDHV